MDFQEKRQRMILLVSSKCPFAFPQKKDIKAITHQTTRSADWYKEMSILMTTLVFSGLARHDYQKILRVCARQMITFAQDKKKL